MCGKIHNIHIHSVVIRSYSNSKKEKFNIRVVRIFCYNNYKRNNESSDKKFQYTKTILPAYLIPYSTKSIALIINGIEYYLSNPNKTLITYAFQINANDPRTFKRYLDLLQKRIDVWIIFIINMIAKLNIAIKESTISYKTVLHSIKHDFHKKWDYFTKLIKLFLDGYDSLKNDLILTNEKIFPYVHMKLCQNHMGLGP